MRWIIWSFAAVVVCAKSASGQVGATRGLEVPTPSVYVTTGAGLHIAEDIFDGSTGTVWNFATAAIFRAAVEKRVGSSVTLGVAAARSKLPLLYSLRSGTEPSETSCTDQAANRCDATATVTQLMATIGVVPGGGRGRIEQVLTIGLGVQNTDNFVEDATGRRLAPLDGDTDFLISVGFGIGFNITERLRISIVQDAGYIMHQRTGLSGERSAFHRVIGTRLGLTLGLGG
jgi:hypothetical protein